MVAIFAAKGQKVTALPYGISRLHLTSFASQDPIPPMPNTPDRTFRTVILPLIVLMCAVCFGATPGSAATALRFSLDRPVDGAAAPFILAANKGLFRAEGLAVTMTSAANSQDAIAQTATGGADIALADINALIRYRDRDDSAPVKAVFVLYDKAPYAIIARKSRGIAGMSDIEGKTIGIADGDLASRLWPAIARHNSLRLGKVKVERMSSAVREPMLSAGQVDAVTGFSFLSAINLRDRGVPGSDLAVLRFSEFGSEVYGHALIVNPKFAAGNPDAVKAFVRAVIAGIRLTIKDPAAAIDDVLAQMSASASRDIELERLRASIRDNIVTDEVKTNGLGGINDDRFAAAVSQIAEGYEFRKRPLPQDIFDGAFLPPVSARRVE